MRCAGCARLSGVAGCTGHTAASGRSLRPVGPADASAETAAPARSLPRRAAASSGARTLSKFLAFTGVLECVTDAERQPRPLQARTFSRSAASRPAPREVSAHAVMEETSREQ